MTDEMITLPLPRENAAQLYRAIESLRPVAARVQEPLGRLPSWQPFWEGSAATTANSEVAALTRLAEDIVVQVEAARSGLSAYAAVVTATHNTVESLRQQWRAGQRRHESERDALQRIESAQLFDPTGIGVIGIAAQAQSLNSAWLRTRTHLLAQHGSAMGTLGTARSQCAATLRACAAGLPGTSAANARGALLGQVWMPGLSASPSEAEAWVTELIARAGRPPSDWDSTEAGLLAEVGDRATDPEIARALMRAIPPDQLTRLVARLAEDLGDDYLSEQRRQDSDKALTVLGQAMVSASYPDSGGGPVNTTDAVWREQWLAGLAASVGTKVGDNGRGLAFRGGHAIAVLLDRAGADRRRLGPSQRFVAVVGMAMIRDEEERLHYSYDLEFTSGHPVSYPSSGVDPLASMLASLDGHPKTAREFLLTPIDSDRRVVEYVVRDRVMNRPDFTMNAATAALAQRLREAAAGTSEDEAKLAGFALNALGDIGAAWRDADPGERERISSEINALRPVAAEMLGRFPDTVASAATRPRPDPAAAVELKGRWSVNIYDQQRMIDLLGQLALDGPAGAPNTSPTDSPSFRHVWNAVVTHHLTDVEQTFAGDDYRAKEAAMNRLGLVLGFTVGSGVNAVRAHNGDVDDANQAVQSATSDMLSIAKVPGAIAKAGGPAGAWVANKVLDFAKAEVMKHVAEKYPTDNAEKVDAASAQANRQTRQDMDVLVWDIVSAAGGWPPEHAPEVWAEDNQLPPAARFWGDDGHPLPIAQLTGPGQLDAFQRWQRLIPSYDTLPMELRLGITEGLTNAG